MIVGGPTVNACMVYQLSWGNVCMCVSSRSIGHFDFVWNEKHFDTTNLVAVIYVSRKILWCLWFASVIWPDYVVEQLLSLIGRKLLIVIVCQILWLTTVILSGNVLVCKPSLHHVDHTRTIHRALNVQALTCQLNCHINTTRLVTSTSLEICQVVVFLWTV